MKLRISLPVILLACPLLASQASAQRAPRDTSVCLDTLSPAAFRRVTVFLAATAHDPRSTEVLPLADFFAQEVALRIRTWLGGSGPELPRGDSAVRWRDVRTEFIMTLHRNGTFSWRGGATSAEGDTARSTASLLARAFRDFAATGERLRFPEDVSGDSVSFELGMRHARFSRTGAITPVRVREAFPVFTIAVPWEEPVNTISPPRIRYPDRSRESNAAGAVRLAFVVDKSGRVIPETVKELWPRGEKRLSGDLAVYYGLFLGAVKRGLPSEVFSPALVGGCAVRQLVEQSFEFDFKR